MNNTRLIKLLRRFDKKELKSFGDFVNSPFLSPARKDTGKLFNYLIQFSPDFDSEEMTIENAFRFIYEEKKYYEKTLRNLVDDLKETAEEFLSFSTLMEDKLEFLLSLSKGYMRKNLTYESNRVNEQIEAKLNPSFSPFTDYFSKLKRLNNLRFVHYNTIGDLPRAMKYLEDIFEASFMQFTFEYMNFIDNTGNPFNQMQRSTNERVFIRMIREKVSPEVMLNLLQFNDDQSDYFKLHYLRFKTILDREDFEKYTELKDHFFRVSDLSAKDKGYLNREERNLFFVYLINYCIQGLSGQDRKYKSEIQHLYKKFLESDSYSSEEGEYLNVAVYRNILLLCTSIEDEQFMIELLEKYINCLHPDFRKDMQHAGYARLEFFRKQFEKTLEHLSMIEDYSIPLLKPDIKHLQLKAFYELSYFDQAYSLINSYRNYLSSTEEIDEVYKVAYMNFVCTCYELLKIKEQNRFERLRDMKKRIENEVHPGFRQWLVEKVNEFK